MDYKVVWSPEAIEDLQSIAEYIQRDSEFYARAVVTKILDVTRSIKDFPLIGRIIPELENENIRERFIYSYRLVYRVAQDTITIVAVIHGKRLFDTVADRMEKDK